MMDEALNGSSWANLQAVLHDKSIPFTLTHGDFHAANFLWSYQGEGELVAVDWTELGVWSPLTELGQMMISDVKPELRRSCEKDLVRGYYDRLVELNPSIKKTFSFEQCWDNYEVHLLEVLLSAVSL